MASSSLSLHWDAQRLLSMSERHVNSPTLQSAFLYMFLDHVEVDMLLTGKTTGTTLLCTVNLAWCGGQSCRLVMIAASR